MMPNCESQHCIKVTTLLSIVETFAKRISQNRKVGKIFNSFRF